MNSDRIKEIQMTTAYPESVSVKQALLQVWNECEQEAVKNCSIPAVINRRELLIAFLRQQNKLHYVTIYENDFEFADKLLKAINCL